MRFCLINFAFCFVLLIIMNEFSLVIHQAFVLSNGFPGCIFTFLTPISTLLPWDNDSCRNRLTNSIVFIWAFVFSKILLG